MIYLDFLAIGPPKGLRAFLVLSRLSPLSPLDSSCDQRGERLAVLNQFPGLCGDSRVKPQGSYLTNGFKTWRDRIEYQINPIDRSVMCYIRSVIWLAGAASANLHTWSSLELAPMSLAEALRASRIAREGTGKKNLTTDLSVLPARLSLTPHYIHRATSSWRAGSVGGIDVCGFFCSFASVVISGVSVSLFVS